MTALVTIVVGVLNAIIALGPKALDLIAQVKAHPDLDPQASGMLDGLQKGIDGHLKYLDEREPLKPHTPVPDPDPTPNHRGG